MKQRVISIMVNQVIELLRKDLLLDIRNRAVLSSVLLYVVSTVFIAYVTFKVIVSVPTWNALFWIICTFACTTAAAKSFSQENRNRRLYYYSITSPQALILSKVLYNCLLLLIINALTYFIFSLFLDNPVQDLGAFLLCLFLGSTALASVFTLISAISALSGSNAALQAILGFPVMIPALITILKFSRNAIDGLDPSLNLTYITVLVALNVIVLVLSFLLFPYLWRD